MHAALGLCCGPPHLAREPRSSLKGEPLGLHSQQTVEEASEEGPSKVKERSEGLLAEFFLFPLSVFLLSQGTLDDTNRSTLPRAATVRGCGVEIMSGSLACQGT